MHPIYVQHPEVLAFIAIENGKIVLDVEETRVPPEHIMIALNQFIGEYLKFVAESNKVNQ